MARPKPLEAPVLQQIKVPIDLRERFSLAARENDQTAAQVLRAFMREYIANHQAKKVVA